MIPKVCPSCREEYVATVERCAECDVPLVAEGEVFAAPEALPPATELVRLRVEHPTWIEILAERLAEAGINLEYAYCTTPPSQSAGALVLRTNDLEATINALS